MFTRAIATIMTIVFALTYAAPAYAAQNLRARAAGEEKREGAPSRVASAVGNELRLAWAGAAGAFAEPFKQAVTASAGENITKANSSGDYSNLEEYSARYDEREKMCREELVRLLETTPISNLREALRRFDPYFYDLFSVREYSTMLVLEKAYVQANNGFFDDAVETVNGMVENKVFAADLAALKFYLNILRMYHFQAKQALPYATNIARKHFAILEISELATFYAKFGNLAEARRIIDKDIPECLKGRKEQAAEFSVPDVIDAAERAKEQALAGVAIFAAYGKDFDMALSTADEMKAGVKKAAALLKIADYRMQYLQADGASNYDEVDRLIDEALKLIKEDDKSNKTTAAIVLFEAAKICLRLGKFNDVDDIIARGKNIVGDSKLGKIQEHFSCSLFTYIAYLVQNGHIEAAENMVSSISMDSVKALSLAVIADHCKDEDGQRANKMRKEARVIALKVNKFIELPAGLTKPQLLTTVHGSESDEAGANPSNVLICVQVDDIFTGPAERIVDVTVMPKEQDNEFSYNFKKELAAVHIAGEQQSYAYQGYPPFFPSFVPISETTVAAAQAPAGGRFVETVTAAVIGQNITSGVMSGSAGLIVSPQQTAEQIKGTIELALTSQAPSTLTLLFKDGYKQQVPVSKMKAVYDWGSGGNYTIDFDYDYLQYDKNGKYIGPFPPGLLDERLEIPLNKVAFVGSEEKAEAILNGISAADKKRTVSEEVVSFLVGGLDNVLSNNQKDVTVNMNREGIKVVYSQRRADYYYVDTTETILYALPQSMEELLQEGKFSIFIEQEVSCIGSQCDRDSLAVIFSHLPAIVSAIKRKIGDGDRRQYQFPELYLRPDIVFSYSNPFLGADDEYHEELCITSTTASKPVAEPVNLTLGMPASTASLSGVSVAPARGAVEKFNKVFDEAFSDVTKGQGKAVMIHVASNDKDALAFAVLAERLSRKTGAELRILAEDESVKDALIRLGVGEGIIRIVKYDAELEGPDVMFSLSKAREELGLSDVDFYSREIEEDESAISDDMSINMHPIPEISDSAQLVQALSKLGIETNAQLDAKFAAYEKARALATDV